MIEAVFTEEMKNILSSMKGKTIKSFEGMFDSTNSFFEEQVRINLGTFCVDLMVRDDLPTTFTTGQGIQYVEEISSFFCKKETKSKPFGAPPGWSVYKYLVNEKISEVLLITDTAETDKGEKYIIDTGIVIKTDFDTYVFSKSFWTVEIFYRKQDEIETPFTLKNLKEALFEEGVSVAVSRQVRFL